jgi:hypothetical protein
VIVEERLARRGNALRQLVSIDPRAGDQVRSKKGSL